MTTPTMTIQVGHLLHAPQKRVHEEFAAVRFGVLVAGRRWRKTSLGVLEALDMGTRGGRAWWVAPIYEQAMIGWRMLTPLVRQIPGVAVKESEHLATFPNGGFVRVRSADNPDSLRGEGLDLVVMDEAQNVDERTWTEVLRPSLTDRQGKALFIGTFRGRNWFWRLWTDAARLDGWKAWKFPSSTNPALDRAELEKARRELPDAVYRQEYECEPTDDAGAVFRNVLGCVHGELEAPRPGRRYVAGLDLARVNDWTVLTIADAETRRVVALERWQGADWGLTYNRIARKTKDYGDARVWVDATGLGDVVVSDLRRAGVVMEPFVLTGDNARRGVQGTKTELINALVLAIEREQIRYPKVEVLVDELTAYRYILTKAGNVSTGAPEGYHDDCVVSLALCNWGLQTSSDGGANGKVVVVASRWGQRDKGRGGL